MNIFLKFTNLTGSPTYRIIIMDHGFQIFPNVTVWLSHLHIYEPLYDFYPDNIHIWDK